MAEFEEQERDAQLAAMDVSLELTFSQRLSQPITDISSLPATKPDLT